MSLQRSARLKLLAEVRSNFSHLSTQPWKTKRVDLKRLTFEEIILCCSNVVNSELLQNLASELKISEGYLDLSAKLQQSSDKNKIDIQRSAEMIYGLRNFMF